MNASRHAEMFRAAAAIDPLANARLDATAIADLAFGSMSVDVTAVEGRHLAMLSVDALELDLDDPLQRQFGDYELKELIGEGGMGVVYRAHQTSLDRDVAIKLLAAGPWASKNFIERFRREAQNAARMQHPNIVAIYEVGSNEELHFFSMRLIRGGSLADLIKQEGKLDPLRAARLLRTIAEAVDYAHKLGVLHLDLKPANVLLDDNGAPHVADFGLARRLEQGLAADTNEVSGTPSYMAPEQCIAAQKVTPATDIWGLGAILYELTTGHPPYLGKTPQETLQLVVEGKLVCPGTYIKNLPADLKAIIAKSMAYEATNRYASARDLADDLARFESGYMVKARPLNTLQRSARWARREPKVVVSALLALLALLVGLVAATMQWRRAEVQRHVAQEQTQLARKNEATANSRLWESRHRAALRLQVDGKAFEALPALIDNIEEQEKAGVPAAVERREVGMILHQGVTLIDRMIIADGQPQTAALSPDGSLLAVGLNDISVRWYDTATLTERGRVDLLDQPTSDGKPRVPALLRFVDNHRLRVTLDWFSYITSPSERDTILVDLDHARAVVAPPAFANFTDADYSANGRYALLFDRDGDGQLWQVEPWQPLSPRERFNAAQNAMSWIVADDGRTAIHFRASGSGITVVDARHPRQVRNVEALSDKHITAWQASHDGAYVAAGDDDGRVHLVDVKTGTARPLSLPSGSEVTWLAFSEDDAWCAVARHDGDAFAFDVASGNMLHSGLLRHDFELRHIELSRRHNLLIASGAGEVALWRMPEQSPSGGGNEAIRIPVNPTHSARASMYWADAAFAAGLLATADNDGEVRLWRLPRDTYSGSRAAPSVGASRVSFDGIHAIDVAYDRIRVVTVDGHHATDWFVLPQPPDFTELADAGRVLVVVSGHALYVFDAATMQLRYAPVQLPGTPNFTEIRADGSSAVFAIGHNRDDGFALRLLRYDLTAGGRQGGEATVRGPIRRMTLSADDKRLLVVGPPDAATEVFDSATLRRVGVYPHNPEQPVISATFLPGTDELWLVETGLDEFEADSGRLVRWDPRSDRLLETRALSGAKPIGVDTIGDKPLLFTRESFVLDPGENARTGPVLRGGEMTDVFAKTLDGQLLAHSVGRNIQLYDTATFSAIGPPLLMRWRFQDVVASLTFDDAGERLLALTGLGKNSFVWNVSMDARATAELRRDAGLLAPAPRTGRVLRLPDAAEHAYLRSHDPGGWPPTTARPSLAVARYVEGAPVPRRSALADPLQLDLTDFYTTTPFTVRNMTDTDMVNTAILPMGIATLDGIDYDIRGGVELRSRAMAGGNATRARDVQPASRGIHVPPVPISGLHVLMLATLALSEPQEREYARIRLHYHGGGEAVLSIHTQRDVPGMTGHDRPTLVGWEDAGYAVVGVLPIQTFASPRLANPHPERIVDSLDLEGSDSGWAEPVFIAITAEPVIPAGASESNQSQGGVE
jgi:WD40 repeat protein